MKGYYLYSSHKDNSVGVTRKIMAQCECFNKSGIDCTPFPAEETDDALRKALFRLPFGPDIVGWPKAGTISDADFLYIRKPLFTRGFLKFMADVKKSNPGIRIYIELPTYPYSREMIANGAKNIPILLRDLAGRRLLYKYVDGMIVIGKVGDWLWKIPAVQYKNGIDATKILCRQPVDTGKDINIMCAASFAPYHGIDIFIKGLADYYRNGGERSIHLYLAGNKARLSRELQIVEENKSLIGERVHTLGVLDAAKLGDLHNKCDLGIVSLGYSRIGLCYNTTIKSKEYLTAGMPFICDTQVDILEGADSEYVLYTTSGEQQTDIQKVIDFYDGLYGCATEDDKKRVALAIREKYSDIIGLDSTMKPVIDMIKGEQR